MKNFCIRKRLLTLLISSNILLTGCSITGKISRENSKKEIESSFLQSSVLDSSEEEVIAESKPQSNELSESSKEETSIEELNIEEETSIEELNIEEETSIEELNIEEETSIEESNTEEDYESKIEDFQESYNEVYTDDSNYVRAITNVNVRIEPNANSKVLSLLYEGNVLKKLGYVGNWYIVEYNGQKAYVSSDYVEEILQEEIIVNLNESNICYFPYGTSLYSDSELTNKIIDIPSLESGQIISQEGNIYLVDTEGYNGYISINSAFIIPQPVVIVDKSEQVLRLYKNNQKEMEFSVVTGNENSNYYYPSDEGLFSIYSKSYNAELVGDTWDVFVNVFMGYNGGEGIHDATWRSSFGGNIYTYNGSHGCINCPYNDVMALAQEVEVGDKVLVKR